jgi:hypothetical protein
VLGKLATGKPLVLDDLEDPRLQEFDASSIESAYALRTMGFARIDGNSNWTISPSGKEYLDLLMR